MYFDNTKWRYGYGAMGTLLIALQWNSHMEEQDGASSAVKLSLPTWSSSSIHRGFPSKKFKRVHAENKRPMTCRTITKGIVCALWNYQKENE
jgi:hypothetical protein